MHVHALSCLPTHMAIQTERHSWWIQCMCKAPFGPHCIMPSHCLYTITRPYVFEMQATSHWITLPSVYRQNLYLGTQSACINILSTSAGSRTHGRIYWQMKNKSTAQSHHPNQLWRPNILFCNCYLGLILGINQTVDDVDHHSIKCEPVVTLSKHSLSHM